MNKSSLKTILLVLLLCLIWIQPVSAAYIDPNTGGMLFQVLAVIFSVLSGIVLIFSSRIKMVFFRLMRMMGGSKNKETPEDKEGGG